MDKKLRDTGIELIGEAFWGTHIGQLYESKDDFFSIACPYIRAGLLNNELCVWVYSYNTNEAEVKSYLDKYINNVDKYIKTGQLLLTSHTNWYLTDNSFNEMRVSGLWLEYVRKSTRLSYEGLRAVADTSWLEKCYYRTFAHYENNVNNMMHELPFIALCLYDENKTDKLQYAEVIKNHSYTIINNENKKELIKNIELIIKDKQLNKALEYNKIKTEFFTNFSHELRTPLNIILGTVQIMELTKQISYENEKYLKILKHNALRLVRLISNLIDLAKIDANFIEIHSKNIDIVSFVEAITSSVLDYAVRKNINIIFDTDIEEKIILCDPDYIERIMLNLLSNAIKFTPKGGKIIVSVHDMDEKINISVIDNGIGIPVDKQNIIFNRFEQVDKSLRREHEGSGIGLSLVKLLVEKLDGNIYVKSQPSKGSEFIVEFPCETIPETSEFNIENTLVSNSIERAKIEFSDIYC
ncbi:MAG: hypothetical protein GX289_07770 [Tissierellia bacterium]|nr:hypothetical protein [Tissierellia bacterium]